MLQITELTLLTLLQTKVSSEYQYKESISGLAEENFSWTGQPSKLQQCSHDFLLGLEQQGSKQQAQ